MIAVPPIVVPAGAWLFSRSLPSLLCAYFPGSLGGRTSRYCSWFKLGDYAVATESSATRRQGLRLRGSHAEVEFSTTWRARTGPTLRHEAAWPSAARQQRHRLACTGSGPYLNGHAATTRSSTTRMLASLTKHYKSKYMSSNAVVCTLYCGYKRCKSDNHI